MTRIDFYVLSSSDETSLNTFVCRLIDKAVAQGSKIMIVTDDEQSASALDQQLWEFKPESYIPHDVITDNTESHLDKIKLDDTDSEKNDIPVRISWGLDDDSHHDVLINLRLTTPQQFGRFERVVEVVNQNKAMLEASRKNYAFYKERGYPINTHKLNL